MAGMSNRSEVIPLLAFLAGLLALTSRHRAVLLPTLLMAVASLSVGGNRVARTGGPRRVVKQIVPTATDRKWFARIVNKRHDPARCRVLSAGQRAGQRREVWLVHDPGRR